MIEKRLSDLRQIMNSHGIDFYFIPSVDPHRNEYVPDHWQRRTFISGFTGSAGDVLVGHNKAYLWTDPRYFLQATSQLDNKHYQLIKMGEDPSLSQWLGQQKDGFVFCTDPKLISITLAQTLESIAEDKKGKIIYPSENWIDQIWQDQPPLPHHPIHLHDAKYAGRSVSQKLKKVREQLKKQNANALVLNSLEAICWLLNVRGNDINYNPLLICNAIVTLDHVTLFVDPIKITKKVAQYFNHEKITTKPYGEFKKNLQQIRGIVLLDPIHCNYWIAQQIQATPLYADSPITLMKALKNEAEQQGMREAHILDALAMIKFFHWLENNWQFGTSEISAADTLETFRRENPLCVDLSFNSISGFGPHGAIVHYAVNEKTNVPITDKSLYLIDSGGQYPFGTTDITRTIHLGTPTQEQKHHYTLVLKGHLAIRHLVFPDGVCGEDINAFAHAPLWQEGLDYGHGTGHGVGCYACVHQSPPTISARKSNWPLKPSMVVSNEPGLYLENQYGIRIENLLLLVDAHKKSLTKNAPFYCFEDLTLVPYARNLILKNELTAEQIKQIDQYHAQIYSTLSQKLKDNSLLSWLKTATKPL